MKFIVLGATGMAGHLVAAYLLERGHDVLGTCRRETAVFKLLCDKGMDAVYYDATDPSLLPSVLRAKDCDVAINCIGLLNRACDDRPDLAVRLNALLPHRLEALTESGPCRVFHLSTDCVFAGNTGPYQEGDEPDGPTLYDLTKASGELHNNKDLTLRQSIVGPDPNSEGIGLLNWFMAQRGAISGYTRAMWTGLTTLELAKAIEFFASADTCGLINMVPEENISKYELLGLFNSNLRCNGLKIEPSDEVVLDKTLLHHEGAFSFVPACYKTQISELAGWIDQHKEFYPHYYERCGE